MWWFETTLKTLLAAVLVDAGKILQLARHFGPWGTVLGPFGSQNWYLYALDPLVNSFFLTCTYFTEEICWTFWPLASLIPDLVPNKLTWELLSFLVSNIHREDRAKIESLSLYGPLEHFNVQITEWKSHPKIPKVYMKYDVIFIKGSRGPSSEYKEDGPPIYHSLCLNLYLTLTHFCLKYKLYDYCVFYYNFIFY